MQAALLALTIWLFSYYPTRSGTRGRHAFRPPPKASLLCTPQLLAGRLSHRNALRLRASSGRHRAAENQVRRAVHTSRRGQTSDSGGCDPAL
jgi:hypothetical protein